MCVKKSPRNNGAKNTLKMLIYRMQTPLFRVFLPCYAERARLLHLPQ